MAKESNSVQAQKIDELEEQQVIDYLNEHPHFIREQLEALSGLDIPHNTGASASLIERQVRVLRSENRQLKDNLKKLIDIARENEELSQRIHQLFIAIIDSDEVDDLLAVVQDQLQKHFNVEEVRFRFFADSILQRHISEELLFDLKNKQEHEIKAWLAQRKPACGHLNGKVFERLFDKNRIKSMAVVPIYAEKDYGLLLMGSQDEYRFSEQKGSVFLNQLGELVSRRLVNLIQNK